MSDYTAIDINNVAVTELELPMDGVNSTKHTSSISDSNLVGITLSDTRHAPLPISPPQTPPSSVNVPTIVHSLSYTMGMQLDTVVESMSPLSLTPRPLSPILHTVLTVPVARLENLPMQPNQTLIANCSTSDSWDVSDCENDIVSVSLCVLGSALQTANLCTTNHITSTHICVNDVYLRQCNFMSPERMDACEWFAPPRV